MVVLSNRDLRENFKVAAIMLSKANGVKLEQVNMDDLTQGYLRSPIDLTVGVSVLQFPITSLDSQIVGAPVIPITMLVASVDCFIAGMFSYYIMLWQFVAGHQESPDFASGNGFMPVTYASSWDNNGTGVAWDPGCNMFWLSNIYIEVNSVVLYKAWDCSRHYYAPQSQATPTIAGSAFIPKQKNQYDGGSDGFYPMEPLPVFSGSKQNIVRLNLPANIPNTISPFSLGGLGYGTTFIAKAVAHWRGVTAKNASSLK